MIENTIWWYLHINFTNCSIVVFDKKCFNHFSYLFLSRAFKPFWVLIIWLSNLTNCSFVFLSKRVLNMFFLYFYAKLWPKYWSRGLNLNNFEYTPYAYKHWYKYCHFRCSDSYRILKDTRYFHCFVIITYIYIKGFALHFKDFESHSHQDALVKCSLEWPVKKTIMWTFYRQTTFLCKWFPKLKRCHIHFLV